VTDISEKGAFRRLLGPSTTSRREREPMPRFLLEVPHASDTLACARAVEIFLLQEIEEVRRQHPGPQ
jgi:hypothetical protein